MMTWAIVQISRDAAGSSACSILELDPDSSPQEDVRRAYRRLARKWHPDKWLGHPVAAQAEAAAHFRAVRAAFESLCSR